VFLFLLAKVADSNAWPGKAGEIDTAPPVVIETQQARVRATGR